MFYVAPFFLIALLLWIERGAPQPRPITPVVAGCAGLLVGVLLFSKLIHLTPTADTLQLTPWWRLQAHGLTAHEAWLVATLVALCAGALFAFIPRRYALALPLLVFLYFSVSQRPIENLLTTPPAARSSPGSALSLPTGSTAASARTATSRRSGRGRRVRTRSGRTSSSTAASARSTTSARQYRAGSRRLPRASTPAAMSATPTAGRFTIVTCSPTTRS